MTNHWRLAYIVHMRSKKCAIDDIQAHFSFDVDHNCTTNIYISDKRYIPGPTKMCLIAAALRNSVNIPKPSVKVMGGQEGKDEDVISHNNE